MKCPQKVEVHILKSKHSVIQIHSKSSQTLESEQPKQGNRRKAKAPVAKKEVEAEESADVVAPAAVVEAAVVEVVVAAVVVTVVVVVVVGGTVAVDAPQQRSLTAGH